MSWLIALFARVALLVVWLATPLVNRAFQGGWILPLLGILILPITENGPESPALSKAGMNGRSFRAGWVEGKHHSSLVLCSPQD